MLNSTHGLTFAAGMCTVLSRSSIWESDVHAVSSRNSNQECFNRSACADFKCFSFDSVLSLAWTKYNRGQHSGQCQLIMSVIVDVCVILQQLTHSNWLYRTSTKKLAETCSSRLSSWILKTDVFNIVIRQWTTGDTTQTLWVKRKYHWTVLSSDNMGP